MPMLDLCVFKVIISSTYLLKSSSSLAIWVPMLPAYIIVPGVLEMPGIIGGDFLQSDREKIRQSRRVKKVKGGGGGPLQPNNVLIE